MTRAIVVGCDHLGAYVDVRRIADQRFTATVLDHQSEAFWSVQAGATSVRFIGEPNVPGMPRARAVVLVVGRDQATDPGRPARFKGIRAVCSRSASSGAALAISHQLHAKAAES